MDIYLDYSLTPGALPAANRLNDTHQPEFWNRMDTMMDVAAAQPVGTATESSREMSRQEFDALLAQARRKQRASRMRRTSAAASLPYTLSFNGVLGRFL